MSKSSKKPPSRAPQFHPLFSFGAPVFDRALAAHQRGAMGEAERLYLQVPRTDPRYEIALHHLGLIQLHRGHTEAGIEYITRSLQINPRNSHAHASLAIGQFGLRQYEESLASCEEALRLDSRNSGAWNSKGNVLRQLGDREGALHCFDRAVSIAPGMGDAWANRGSVLRDMGLYDQSVRSFDHALSISPERPDYWSDRGKALFDAKRLDEALVSFENTIRLNPGGFPTETAELLGFTTAQQLVLWDGLAERSRLVMQRVRLKQPITMVFALLSHPDVTALELRECGRRHFDEHYALFSKPAAAPPRREGRIRVAYLSADFRHHAASYLSVGLFEQHDRERFEVWGVMFRKPGTSALSLRLERAFDRFIDVSADTDDQVAEMLRKEQVDIAVDLMGYTSGERTGIFARRCAPIQINYLGYPGTMGAPCMDYIIGDRWVTPPERAEEFSEKLVLMPHSFQINDDQRPIAPTTPSRRELGLPEAAFVFCCHNNTYKITPQQYDLWMRLLTKLPHAVLWLVGDNETARRNLRAQAQARGVAAERIVFAPRVPYAQYLAQYRQADLFLDTLPFNAGTTASDALWAGLPVLTEQGHTFAGRMAASLLAAVGLPELITPSREAYEAMAMKLALEPELLRSLRDRLQAHLPSAPLFDTRGFARKLERAFEHMVARQQQGLAPEHIDVATLDAPADSKAPQSMHASSARAPSD